MGLRFLRRTMGALLAAAVVSAGIGIVAPTAAQADGNVSAFLNHLNNLRASQGLGALTLASDLNAIAQAHSEQMAQQGTIFHNQSLQSQVTNWQTLGENVGMGPSEAAIDNAFDNSPAHYANEVNSSFTQVGIGSVTAANGQIFVTLDFRKPMRDSAPAPADSPAASKTTAAKSSTPSSSQITAAAAAQAAAQQAAEQLAAQQAAEAAARAAARAAAEQQNAALTNQLRSGTDPIACAMVFSALINSLGQTG